MTFRRRAKQSAFLVLGAALAANGVVAAVHPGSIETLYGIRADGPDLEVLLRHRGVMLALLGGLLAAAGPLPRLRGVAAVTAAAGMAGFVALVLTTEGLRPEQLRVARLDLCLLAGLAMVLLVPDEPER